MNALALLNLRGAELVLITLEAYPQRQFTISELAKTSQVPFASVWRLVKAWEKAGLLQTGRVGNSVTVSLKQSPYSKHLEAIRKINLTPQAFALPPLVDLLRRDPRVKQAYLFGSVATGTETLDSDIDLALLVRPGFDAETLAFQALDAWGVKVMPILFFYPTPLKAFLKGKTCVNLLDDLRQSTKSPSGSASVAGLRGKNLSKRAAKPRPF